MMCTRNPKRINNLLQTSHVELHATGKAWPSDELQTTNYGLAEDFPGKDKHLTDLSEDKYIKNKLNGPKPLKYATSTRRCDQTFSVYILRQATTKHAHCTDL